MRSSTIKNNSKKNHQLKLIEGNFTAPEAGKFLFALLNSKINYHTLEIFSAKERAMHSDTKHNEKRIEELKAAKEALKKIILSAEQKNQKLSVNSIIKIELLNV